MWESVNVSLNPELKPKVLNQEILRLRCSECDSILMLGYPLLYHDMEQQVMIQFEPPPGPPMEERLGIPDYTLRVVASPEHLIEKIVVFDHKLDDRAVEVLKHRVCNELIRDHGDTLLKLKALPLNPDTLLCIGPTDADGEKSVDFMIPLLSGLPGALMRTHYTAYLDAEREIDQARVPLATERWEFVNYHWADRFLDGRKGTAGVKFMFAPEFIFNHQIGRSILDRHVELLKERTRTHTRRPKG